MDRAGVKKLRMNQRTRTRIRPCGSYEEPDLRHIEGVCLRSEDRSRRNLIQIVRNSGVITFGMACASENGRETTNAVARQSRGNHAGSLLTRWKTVIREGRCGKRYFRSLILFRERVRTTVQRYSLRKGGGDGGSGRKNSAWLGIWRLWSLVRRHCRSWADPETSRDRCGRPVSPRSWRYVGSFVLRPPLASGWRGCISMAGEIEDTGSCERRSQQESPLPARSWARAQDAPRCPPKAFPGTV